MRLQQLYTSATLQNDGALAISGKVTRLGSTTFEITARSEEATAVYACQNRDGNLPEDPKKQTVSRPVLATTGELPTPDDGQVRFQSLTLEAPDSILRRSGGQRIVLASISYEDVQLRLFENGALVGKFSLGPFSEVFFSEVFE